MSKDLSHLKPSSVHKKSKKKTAKQSNTSLSKIVDEIENRDNCGSFQSKFLAIIIEIIT
jgi:hypothetical protein